MPTYEYRCLACGRQVEVMHGIEAPGPAECAVCGGVMRKALSTPAIHFKGSGWAKKDARAAAAATSTSKPTEGGGSDAGGGAAGTGTGSSATSDAGQPGVGPTRAEKTATSASKVAGTGSAD